MPSSNLTQCSSDKRRAGQRRARGEAGSKGTLCVLPRPRSLCLLHDGGGGIEARNSDFIRKASRPRRWQMGKWSTQGPLVWIPEPTDWVQTPHLPSRGTAPAGCGCLQDEGNKLAQTKPTVKGHDCGGIPGHKAKNTEMGGIPGLESGGKGISSRGDPWARMQGWADGSGGVGKGARGWGRGQSKEHLTPDQTLLQRRRDRSRYVRQRSNQQEGSDDRPVDQGSAERTEKHVQTDLDSSSPSLCSSEIFISMSVCISKSPEATPTSSS